MRVARALAWCVVCGVWCRAEPVWSLIGVAPPGSAEVLTAVGSGAAGVRCPDLRLSVSYVFLAGPAPNNNKK